MLKPEDIGSRTYGHLLPLARNHVAFVEAQTLVSSIMGPKDKDQTARETCEQEAKGHLWDLIYRDILREVQQIRNVVNAQLPNGHQKIRILSVLDPLAAKLETPKRFPKKGLANSYEI